MIKKTFAASLQTTDTTLYEVPASETATMTVFDGYSVSSKEFFKIGGEYNEFIAMYAGDKIIGRCATNNDFTMFISVIEENDVIQGG